jgi:hypothetical protein
MIQPDPLIYHVIVHWNEIPPADPNPNFDLRITPWNTKDWVTEDIWIDSQRNEQAGRKIYTHHEDGDETRPILNGDEPWVPHVNTILVRVRNLGVQDVTDVVVAVYLTVPPGIGDNGSWSTLATKMISSIPAKKSSIVEFDWRPAANKQTCVCVAI